jgi:hypothetical protein
MPDERVGQRSWQEVHQCSLRHLRQYQHENAVAAVIDVARRKFHTQGAERLPQGTAHPVSHVEPIGIGALASTESLDIHCDNRPVRRLVVMRHDTSPGTH